MREEKQRLRAAGFSDSEIDAMPIKRHGNRIRRAVRKPADLAQAIRYCAAFI